MCMKRVTLIGIQLVLVLSLSAQNYQEPYLILSKKQEPRLGITGGMQLANFHSTTLGDPNVQGGFHFGMTCQFPLTKLVSFEPQLMYSKKGGEIDYTQVAYFYYYSGSLRYRLHYIEMPLQFNFHISQNVDLMVGGYASYLADATFNVTTAAGYGYGELNYGDFEKYDFGLSGGMAFNFLLSKLTLKYAHGLNEVARQNSAYIFLEGAKNSVFSISFTRYFR